MDDYVMVPREPTEEMVLNGVKAFQHSYSETNVLEDWKDCYRAMIAMAPPIHKREWVGLTDREFQPMIQKAMAYYGYDQSEPSHLTAGAGFRVFAYAIEAKLREKNGG